MKRSSCGAAWAALAFLTALMVVGHVAVAQQEQEDDALLTLAKETWTGDLDGIVERGFLRVATAYDPILFLYDGIEQRGAVHDIARKLERHFSRAYAPRGRRIDMVIKPMARDRIVPSVAEGLADIAIADLTVTPERQETVAFSEPTDTNISELVVTGPAAPDVTSFDDLARVGLFLRRSSSYFEHVQALNAKRAAQGLAPIPVQAADERLEDYDLLELVQAGTIPAVVVDSLTAGLWAQVFDKIKVHEDLTVASGQQIAWALRQDSPKLKKAVDEFVKTVREGSRFGNILAKRYLKSPRWVENVMAREARSRYEKVFDIIKTFSGQYDFDWLIITAQGYQESRLDQKRRSASGAVGIMQILPATAAGPNVRIPDIYNAKNNVHAGVKYMDFLRKQYFSDPAIDPVDQVLLSFGAYNAGPGNIHRARRRAVKMGLDPNKWFDNVEIAAGRVISRQPVDYVRNIYKYYVAYQYMENLKAQRKEALEAVEQ